MKPTDVLSSEHRVIEQVLGCLEKMADDCQRSGKLEKQPALDAVEFIRNFADRCHHGKEETHLFPALEANGFPREGGPTGVMLAEHEQGRACVRGMAENIDGASAGDAAAAQRFVAAARGYVELLRQHIYKEDNILFALAGRVLSAEEQERLLQAFQKVEVEHMGVGAHEKYLRIARELGERYGVPQSAGTQPVHFTCCGH